MRVTEQVEDQVARVVVRVRRVRSVVNQVRVPGVAGVKGELPPKVARPLVPCVGQQVLGSDNHLGSLGPDSALPAFLFVRGGNGLAKDTATPVEWIRFVHDEGILLDATYGQLLLFPKPPPGWAEVPGDPA